MTTNRNTLTIEKAIKIALKRWKFIAVFGFICAVLTAGFSLTIPNKYSAKGTILPGGRDSGGGSLLSLAGNIPGLDMMGLGIGDNSPSALYPSILMSRQITDKVLKHEYACLKEGENFGGDLYAYFDMKNRDAAFEKLKSLTSVNYDKKTGIVSVTVTTESPELSAQIANAFISSLDDYNKNQRQTGAGQNKEFIEKRLVEASAELAKAEDSLKSFREQNLDYYRTTDPELLMLHERLIREVEMKNKIYMTLVSEHELASIQAKKETPVVQVLDYAKPPTLKSEPSRSKMTMFGFMAGLMAAFGIIIIDQLYRGKKEYEEFMRRTRTLKLIRRTRKDELVEHV